MATGSTSTYIYTVSQYVGRVEVRSYPHSSRPLASRHSSSESKVKQLIEKVDPKGDRDYSIVGIMGCQSSGKSTLLNKLFRTKFQVMNSQMGRSQTTKGIWLDAARNTSNLAIMDLEVRNASSRAGSVAAWLSGVGPSVCQSVRGGGGGSRCLPRHTPAPPLPRSSSLTPTLIGLPTPLPRRARTAASAARTARPSSGR